MNPAQNGAEQPLWRPSEERIADAQMTAFRRAAERVAQRQLPDYAALHAFSVDAPEAFWQLVWDFCEVRAEHRGQRVGLDLDRMPGARWFPDARLNFAENLLRRRDDEEALIFRNETGDRTSLSFRELYLAVGSAEAALRDAGVEPGDRVAGQLPNRPEAVVIALACASLGALWSSCSPDFGEAGVIDRFGQIEPRVLFVTDGYTYGGRRFDTRDRIPALRRALPSVERCVLVPNLSHASQPSSSTTDTESWEEFLAPWRGSEPSFTPLPFDHPLYILYSSGTTGRPKCIVHGAGGTLLQHLKEHRLHVDLRRGDRLFYFTTCGWMMWNWLVSGLGSEAGLLLYDGSPAHPDPGALFRMAAEEGVTVFGTSAKFIDAVAKSGVIPREECALGSLRVLLSTGSPLSPEGFDFVYEEIHPDLQLASISGGTDIISCFVLGNPTEPVWRGEIQAPGLGMRVAVYDDDGRVLRDREGELVCTRPFPSMPLGFWNDPDDARYRAAYFETYPGVWHHGDWIRETPRGGYVISGRSDAVLNPGGVRIGTSEIYRAVQRLDEVLESIAIGQELEGDVRVVLFVLLREGRSLDGELAKRIRDTIRTQASPRHVPAIVLGVADIPRTRSGKITELAVRDVVHGRVVKNLEALANPEALEHFRDRPELSV